MDEKFLTKIQGKKIFLRQSLQIFFPFSASIFLNFFFQLNILL